MTDSVPLKGFSRRQVLDLLHGLSLAIDSSGVSSQVERLACLREGLRVHKRKVWGY